MPRGRAGDPRFRLRRRRTPVTARRPTATATTPAAETTLEALWRAPGEDVAVVPGTSDHRVGANRISFLVVDKQGRVVERPTARVWLARGLKQVPFAQTTARLEPIGVPGGESAGVENIYVATITTPTPGKYWFLAEPVGGTKIQALGNVVVARKSAAPSVGDRAIPSKTPTLASTGGDLTALTTSRRPDRALLSNVGRAGARGEAAVRRRVRDAAVLPDADVRADGGRRLRGAEVAAGASASQFIHVEIYEDNDPAKGMNRWVKEWHLPTEPFTFVVDRTGVIRTKLEGAYSRRRARARGRRGPLTAERAGIGCRRCRASSRRCPSASASGSPSRAGSTRRWRSRGSARRARSPTHSPPTSARPTSRTSRACPVARGRSAPRRRSSSTASRSSSTRGSWRCSAARSTSRPAARRTSTRRRSGAPSPGRCSCRRCASTASTSGATARRTRATTSSGSSATACSRTPRSGSTSPGSTRCSSRSSADGRR